MKFILGFICGSIYTFCLYISILYNWSGANYPLIVLTGTIVIIMSMIFIAKAIEYVIDHWND